MPHLKQPREQSFLIWTLLSLLLEQRPIAPLRSASIILNNAFGHAAAHFPQARHFDLSTFGRPSAPILKASKGHTFTQSPKPIQPKAHFFVPLIVSWAALHVFKPMYSALSWAHSFVPAQARKTNSPLRQHSCNVYQTSPHRLLNGFHSDVVSLQTILS